MLDWARAQAGQCVRALRLEMLLLVIYHLQARATVCGGMSNEAGNRAGISLGILHHHGMFHSCRTPVLHAGSLEMSPGHC